MARSKSLVLALLCWAALAHGQIDCAKPPADPGPRLSAHLKDYAEACAQAPAEKRLREWKLPAKEDQVAPIVLAWRELATDFDKLAARAAAQPDALKQVLQRIAHRAQATAFDVATLSQGKTRPDVTSFGKVAWEIPAKGLILPAIGDLSEIQVDLQLDPLCKDRAAATCRAALEHGRELMLHWKTAENLSQLASEATVAAIAKQVAAKEALWNRYLYDSKPMLPPDFFLTDLLTGGWSKSDQYPEGFREPPKTQWFLAHPSVGAEYASSVGDGEQLKPILYLEVIGFNRWNERDRIDIAGLRYFSGLSLIVSYADRAGVTDAGYGALLTFDNVYSVGVTRYGSETAVLLSLDLANLFREKYKPLYQKFKQF